MKNLVFYLIVLNLMLTTGLLSISLIAVNQNMQLNQMNWQKSVIESEMEPAPVPLEVIKEL